MQEHLLIVKLAIEEFARRCIEHSGLEEDPALVIATERELVFNQLERESDEKIGFRDKINSSGSRGDLERDRVKR